MKRILSFIKNNLYKLLVFLIIASLLNIAAFVMALERSNALAFSAFFCASLALYAFTNIGGARRGAPQFNAHLIRRYWLRKRDKEAQYEQSCLKYLAVLLPLVTVWAIFNFVLAIICLI